MTKVVQDANNSLRFVIFGREPLSDRQRNKFLFTPRCPVIDFVSNGPMSTIDNDTVYLGTVVTFDNMADALAFKLKWC